MDNEEIIEKENTEELSVELDDKNKTKSKKNLIWQLFATFFKIGLFTFGGGYAMIPLIQRETVENKGWVTEDDILEIVAIAESTPGPIAINTATFVGSKTRGFWGAFFATLGVILPSFIIIFLISFLLEEFQSLKVVSYAFWGIRIGVLSLILKALWGMFKKSPKGIVSYIIIALALIMVAIIKIPAIFVIIGCALIGLISSIIAERKVNKK